MKNQNNLSSKVGDGSLLAPQPWYVFSDQLLRYNRKRWHCFVSFRIQWTVKSITVTLFSLGMKVDLTDEYDWNPSLILSRSYEKNRLIQPIGYYDCNKTRK